MSQGGARVIPTLRYRDARAAIDFLERAFGFEPRMVVDGDGGIVEHAQLVSDDFMVMLGTARDDDFGALQGPPRRGEPVTQSPYIVVVDVDAHHARAAAAGAEVVMEPEDQDHGGRFYACRDPEGHLWNFGSYDTWVDGDD